MSINNEKAIGQEGLVSRSQAYDTAQVRLDMTAHLKGPLRNRQNKGLKEGSLMKVKSIAECSFGAFCNLFDLH